LIDEIMNKKTQESFHKLSNVMSNCLSRIMKGFRLQFEISAPSTISGQFENKVVDDSGDVPFGNGEDSGGQNFPNETGGGGQKANTSSSGVRDNSTGGGGSDQNKARGQGFSQENLLQSSGPKIEFQNHAGASRIIDLGDSLIINTQHADFIQRNSNKSGKIKLDNRLINYVSMVVTPPCVHKLFEKKGKIPTALEVGSNVIDLGLKLENELTMAMLNEEIDKKLN
jgi:hypothetical protein